MAYKRKWRETDRLRKRHNRFIVEYIKIKYGNIYNEANGFFIGLNNMYKDKLDLRGTKEFKRWQKSVTDSDNPEELIITQTLRTDVSYDQTTTTTSYTENSNETATTSYTENPNETATTSYTDTESETETAISDQDDSTEESDNETSTETINDGMVLEIPLLQSYDHSQNVRDIGAEPNEYEIFSDERINEIVQELRNDPELHAIFADRQDLNQEDPNQEEDEGVALPTLEEEIHLDFEDFDYRLEVELADW